MVHYSFPSQAEIIIQVWRNSEEPDREIQNILERVPFPLGSQSTGVLLTKQPVDGGKPKDAPDIWA